VSLTLSSSDAMLCVRGSLYPRRGSALAGIACGLPIVGYAGAVERTPLAEAGIELVPYGNGEALGTALARVLTDERLHAELQNRNRRVLEKYFCWSEIAKRYIEALDSTRGTAMDAH
jgi:glycosyltransferase involved in cell wall biosynthesis